MMNIIKRLKLEHFVTATISGMLVGSLVVYFIQYTDAIIPIIPPIIIFFIIFITIVLLPHLILGRKWDVLAPLNLITGIYILLFMVPSVIHIVTGRYAHADILGVLPKALWLVLFSYACLLVGYYSKLAVLLGKRLPKFSNINYRKVSKVVLLYGIIGFSSYFLFLHFNGGILEALLYQTPRWIAVRPGTGYFFWGLLFMISFITLFYVNHIQISKKQHLVPVLLFILVFLMLLVLGGRARALAPLIILLIVAHYLVRRVRTMHLLVFLVFILFIAPIVQFFRGYEGKVLLLTNPVEFWQAVKPSYGKLAYLFTADIGRIEAIAIALKEFPENQEYMMGKTMFAAPLGPIVRRLPFHIPMRSPGILLAQIVYPEMKEGEKWGLLPTLVGELYMNFSIIGVAIGFLVLGLLLRILYSWVINNKRSPYVVAIYAVSLYYFIRIMTEDFSKIFEYFVVVLPIIFAIRYARRRSRHPTA